MGKQRKIGKKLAALVIIAVVFAGVAALHLAGVFQSAEYMSYDLRVRLMAKHSRPSNDIVLILLRQDCLDWAQKERGWGWPWPRQAYAEIVDYLSLGGAKSVAFDMIFSEPSIYRNALQDDIIDGVVKELERAQSANEQGLLNEMFRPLMRRIVGGLRSLSAGQDDAAFTAAEKRYGKVIQSVFFSSQTGSASQWPAEFSIPLFQPENFGPLLDQFAIGESAQFPILELGRAAGALGAVTGKPDSDGIIRRLRIFSLFDGKAVPGISAASLLVAGKEREITYDKKNSALQWGDYTIPINAKGETLLRYRGEIDRYNPYRAMDILQSAEAFAAGKEPLLPPDNFKDAHVFFGLYAPGLFDIFSTPINSVYAGMGCHVTMLDNLLQGDFITESPAWLDLLILLAVTGLMALLALFSRNISLSVSGLLFLVIVIIAGSFIAYGQGLWLPMVTYIAGTLAAFITVTLYNYATEGSQKRFIKSAFSQYLSPNVIDQIISDPSQLKLGGEKREMTAIFTDIRSFSTFSEALGDPAKLVELLNFYLTRMSDIVLENKGTIDKYEGDAIIAFFGAPVRLGNHASLACRSAVCMKKAEAAMNREALAQGLITPQVVEALTAKGILKSADDPCPIFTRLGVNTGDMVVGNMGTLKKMDYTIMGNAVNLAARLEGVNKQYNTGGILISEYTRKVIGDEFIARPLSRVRVVGINTPLRLYELLDIAREAPSEVVAMVENWEQGFALYEKRNFKAALNIFEKIGEKNGADLVAKKYMDRCAAYIAAPPDAAAWDDAVDNLTEK